MLENKRILITGGTGSLGNKLVERLLSNRDDIPQSITIFSRDELKQADMKALFKSDKLKFIIGDVRTFQSVLFGLRDIDVVINAAALKRVEVCEQFPDEAIATNYMGIANIVKAIREYNLPIETVVNVGSDKGSKPLNIYGMTKALQEARTLVANSECRDTRFVGVRYGNVMSSRGSVIPIWQSQLSVGAPITVNDPTMSRFLVTLDRAVDTLLMVIEHGDRGDVYIPKLPAATIGDMAKALAGDNIVITGKHQMEKMHETLIAEEEANRVLDLGFYYCVSQVHQSSPGIDREYISSDCLMDLKGVKDLFRREGYIK